MFAIARLRTHPGIDLLSSLCLVHTLQPVARFRNTRKVAAYAGFDPVERSSEEHKRFLGISKAGSRLLRHLMVEAANVAVRKDEDLKRSYQRVADRRGPPKAKVAVARKLLIRAYIMLRDEIDYAKFRRRAVNPLDSSDTLQVGKTYELAVSDAGVRVELSYVVQEQLGSL